MLCSLAMLKLMIVMSVFIQGESKNTHADFFHIFDNY